VDSLRARIKELESLLETRLNRSEASAPTLRSASHSGSTAGHVDAPDTVRTAPESRSESFGDHEDDSLAELDGMGPRGEAVPVADQDSGQSSTTFFGPSSVVSGSSLLPNTTNSCLIMGLNLMLLAQAFPDTPLSSVHLSLTS
jgi:hypothetical protein